MKTLALVVALMLPQLAVAQSTAGLNVSSRIVETCEGQLCYLRCSGSQTFSGTITFSSTTTLCWRASSFCLSEASGILLWSGNNGIQSGYLRATAAGSSIILSGTDPGIYASDANSSIGFISNISAANAGATVPTAMAFARPTNALDAADYVWAVGDSADATQFAVTHNGIAYVTTQLVTPRVFLTGGGSSATDIGTDPTVVACSGTAASITVANGTAAVQFDVGTACAGESTAVLTMPAATTGWVCSCSSTTADRIIQQKVMPNASTTTVTLQNVVISTGANGDFTDGTDVACLCRGL
jgi:hypothetical protein